MSTKRQVSSKAPEKAPTNGKNGNNWRGFVNVEIDNKDKELVLRMVEDPIMFYRAVESLLVEGYKISLSHNSEQGVYIATATGTNAHATDEGLACTARSMKVENSLAALTFKVLEVCKGDLNALWSGPQQYSVDV